MVLCGNKTLTLDTACLKIFNYGDESVHFSGQRSDCYECDYIHLANIPRKMVKYLEISTHFPFGYEATTENYSYCNNLYQFQQRGIYGVNISTISCSEIFVISPPDDAFKPLWVEALILFITVVIWAMGTCAKNSTWLKQLFRSNYVRELENDLGTPLNSESPMVQSEFVPSIGQFKSRMKSLDTFRGLNIILMVFFNAGGGNYWFFNHSMWNGMTICDMVFPWFTWIMGASLILSIKSQLRERVKRRTIFFKCLRRSLVLIAIGLILNSKRTDDIFELRIPGILQRLGITYFIVATMEIFLMEPQAILSQHFGRFSILQDLISSWVQWLVMLACVFAHYIITFYLPLDNGCPTGYLGPGGLHEHGKYMNCTGGAAGFIDKLIIGQDHLIKRTPSSTPYNSTFHVDPEGILGTLNMTFLVFLGAQAGMIMLCYSNTSSKIRRWIIWAVLTGFLGGQFCDWQQEGGWIPLNKHLWSLSFVLVTSSLAYFCISILLVVVDHTKWWSGSPFQQVGKNSLLIYIGSELMKSLLPWTWKPIFGRTTHTEYLIMDSWSAFLWICIAVFLDKYGIYLVI